MYQRKIDWAIRGQIDSILEYGEAAEDQNPNAMRYAREFVEALYLQNFIGLDEYEDTIDLLTPKDEDD